MFVEHALKRIERNNCDMKEKKISIIVPIYKVEKVLKRCVDSLIEQTYKNIEIILVDDGSPDQCGKICDKYANQDDRIIVIHKKNGGLSSARNEGLKKASGDYIMFVDSDDFIEISACQELACFFKGYPDIIIGDCVTVNENYEVLHCKDLKKGEIFLGKEYMVNALKNNFFPVVVWLNIYKREFLLSNNLFFAEGRLHEDIEFTPRVLYFAEKVVYSKCRFYHYVTHEESISSAKDRTKHCKDIYKTCIELNNMITDKKENTLQKLLNDYLCNCYLGTYRVGNLYCKGKEYVHKKYVLKNAYNIKTKMKAILFGLSPKLYCRIGKNG